MEMRAGAARGASTSRDHCEYARAAAMRPRRAPAARALEALRSQRADPHPNPPLQALQYVLGVGIACVLETPGCPHPRIDEE